MMSGFSADWLAMREPFDSDARSHTLAEEFAVHAPRSGPMEIVDLATGTGANMRFLAPRIGGHQRWTVVDHDARLLAAVAPCLARWADLRGYRYRPDGAGAIVTGVGFEAQVQPLQRDLARNLDRVVHQDVHMVTAAALLDLVSEDWLARIAGICRSVGATIFFALTYDGEAAWSPEDTLDESARDALNRHQRIDKGFGAALGPDAAVRAKALFRALGYRLMESKSDWRIGPAAQTMQHALLEGWRRAAMAIAPEHGDAFSAWAARRAAAIEQGVSAVRVGHVDIAGWPEGLIS
jgi:hypothetical protein